MAYQIVVEGEKCKGCEECLEICTAGVFEKKGGKSIPVHPTDCLGCANCVEVCKEKAIRVEAFKVGLSETCQTLLRDIL